MSESQLPANQANIATAAGNTGQKLSTPSIAPLAYHKHVCDYLQSYESKVWEWFADLKTLEKNINDTRDLLLKETYRLTPESNPTVYELCEQAMQTLGIQAPITVYQANDGAMNAALFYIPGEIHIVMYGPIIEKMTSNELLALLGHELSHYLLWSLEEGRYLVAQQILEDSVANDPQNNALYETARLFGLHTEIFADRGSVLVTQDELQPIAVLVKVMTGLSDVNASTFLTQAKELEAKGEISKANSHPELYLRALFIDKWQRGEHDIDAWISTKLKGPLSIHSLDILDQIYVSKLTKTFFDCFLQHSSFASELVISQIKEFFPSWHAPVTAPVTAPIAASIESHENEDKQAMDSENNQIDFAQQLPELASDKVDDSVIDYFIALIFDIAHADQDQRDEVLQVGAQFAHAMDWPHAYLNNLKQVLKFPKRKAEKIAGVNTKKASDNKEAKA